MTDLPYFSDRENGERARIEETITKRVWEALYELIQGRINDGSFGFKFPVVCDDGHVPYGTDYNAFWRTAQAEIPDLPEYVHAQEVPDRYVILDLLEFGARNIAQPIQRDYHGHFRHYHLDFDRNTGLTEFISSVNRLFSRNGIAFELTSEGVIQRLGPPSLREELRRAVFHTGDTVTDRLLEDSRQRILSPDPQDRRDAVEKIWDAFERIKTLEPGANKKEQVNRLIDRSVSSTATKFREIIETEAQALTRIGNTLLIRHSETDKETLDSLEHVDYLFFRMFSFLLLLLKSTQRAA